jgi:hypothetical protein
LSIGGEIAEFVTSRSSERSEEESEETRSEIASAKLKNQRAKMKEQSAVS